MATVVYEQVGKKWPDGSRALRGLDLSINDGEFLVLVGASGCGKSTALRILAGLEQASEGAVYIADRRVNNLTPQARNIAMVFQSYALYPHMSVRDNLRFPLQMRRVSKQEEDRLVADAARMLNLEELMDRRPAQLSGGQRQRVAMGRALVRQPDCFLMDEPLSNLDAKLRVHMRAEIIRLQRSSGITTVYVTHDQVEAMTMGERVAVMHGGRLRQCAAPEELYRNPADVYVAGFIGSPSMNLCQVSVQRPDESVSLLMGEQSLALPPAIGRLIPGDQAVVGLRPEAIVPPDQVPENQRLKLVPEEVESLGHERILHLTMPLESIAPDASVDQSRIVTAPPTTWTARLPGDFPVQRGEAVTLGFNTKHLHVFDQQGKRINPATA
ncbi:MAG: ATP-binding cassette domain-containing protein [Planctomycetota bacterium]|nr:MAG: ATP-binding cassette domain-containing protein [Planctomycetota bacterium]